MFEIKELFYNLKYDINIFHFMFEAVILYYLNTCYTSKRFADILGYTNLSIFSLVPTLARLSVLHCEDMPG